MNCSYAALFLTRLQSASRKTADKNKSKRKQHRDHETPGDEIKELQEWDDKTQRHIKYS